MRSLPWFLLVAAASFFTLQFQSLPAADPIKIGGGPKDIVLAWDAARSDLPRTKEGPSLQVRGDGSLSVTDPHGAGQPIEAKLSADQLQDLLQFVVREQGIREIDSAKLEKEIRTARAKDGLPPEGSGVFSMSMRVKVEGKEHEVRCVDLAANAERGPLAKKLAAIHGRFERLRAWAYAGGAKGLEASLKVANEQLHRDFPEAPLLTADDLQSALQRTNGSAQVLLERRGVAPDKNRFSFIHAAVDKDSPQGTPRASIRASLASLPNGSDVKQARKGPFLVDPPAIASDPSIRFDSLRLSDRLYPRAARL